MPPPLLPVAALILVTGPNARMRSRHPKVTHRILGKPLGSFSIDLCRALGAERIIVSVADTEELTEVKAALGAEVEYVQAAAAELIQAAASRLGPVSGPVIVTTAGWVPAPMDGRLLTEAGRSDGTAGATAHFLRFDRAHSGQEGANETESIVAAGLFQGVELGVTALSATNSDEVDLLASYRPTLPPGAAILRRSQGGLVVEDRAALAATLERIRIGKVRELMASGVTVEDPATAWIGLGVTMGADTIIRPNSYLEGSTVIGSECVIGPNVQITDCVIADRVVIHNAVLTKSEVGDETKIGPYTQLRPGSRVKRKVKIGNFVELKNAVVDDRASLGHFAYIGDASVGEHTNIGAGTITCNYDGKRKHRTYIGKEVFVGTHATLVAPVTIGDGAFIAAGSVITQDVPDNALAVGRSRQSNKHDWATRRRHLQDQDQKQADGATSDGNSADVG